jgi:hypothetical protein
MTLHNIIDLQNKEFKYGNAYCGHNFSHVYQQIKKNKSFITNMKNNKEKQSLDIKNNIEYFLQYMDLMSTPLNPTRINNIRDDIDTYIDIIQNITKDSIIKNFRDLFNDLFSQICKNLKINYNKFNEYVELSENSNLEYSELLEDVFSYYINNLPPAKANNFVKATYHYYYNNYPEYYDTIMENKSKLTNKTLVFVIYHHKHDSDKIFNDLCYSLKDHTVWNLTDATFWSITNNKLYLKKIMKNNLHHHKSWFINNMLIDSHPDIKSILILATLDTNMLRSLDEKNLIPHDLLLKVNIKTPMIFRYYSYKNNTLEERLFSTNYTKDANNYTQYYDHFYNYNKINTHLKSNDVNQDIEHNVD